MADVKSKTAYKKMQPQWKFGEAKLKLRYFSYFTHFTVFIKSALTPSGQDKKA